MLLRNCDFPVKGASAQFAAAVILTGHKVIKNFISGKQFVEIFYAILHFWSTFANINIFKLLSNSYLRKILENFIIPTLTKIDF